MAIYIEDMLPGVKYNGLNTAGAVDFSGASSVKVGSPVISGGLTASGSTANDFSGSTGTFLTSTGAVTIGSGAISVTGSVTMAAAKSITISTGGLVPTGTAATVFHSGSVGPGVAAFGTDTTPVVTETYFCEVFIPHNATLTGLSVLNGTAVSGNINVGLASSAGAIVAQSATTTAGSGTNAYQAIPFTTTYAAVGPAKYFAVVQYAATTARYRTHILGNFGAAKKTSETYGTFTSGYTTTTFATAGAIVADTY